MMPTNTIITEAALAAAYSGWHAALKAGREALKSGDAQAALAPLSEAIRISAAYHPEFHFLESGMNTELGRILRAQGDGEGAKAAFERAVFLHHQNEVALAGLASAPILPAYTMAARNLASWAAIGGGKVVDVETCLFTLRAQAKTVEDWRSVISLTDEAHKQYHKLAAEPWFLRAKAHRALGEKELASNDQRRAEDLQPVKRSQMA